MKVTKSQLKELIRYSIKELASEIEDVNESKKRRFTVKEVRMWMKKLEENRYKKVYNSDARRVAWMVNNEGVSLDEMPISMKKKWSKAQYGRERYLATEFLKSKSEQMTEGKLTEGVFGKFDTGINFQGNGLTVYDRNQSKGGDFKSIAFIANGKVKLYDKDVKKEPKLMKALQNIAKSQLQVEGKLNEKFDLKKLEDAIKMFQKKIKKQGRVTNARDEDHLKQLIKVYKQMGGKKIKEQKLREQIREIIREQLNEQKFKKVILPNDMKTKVKVSKMIKQLKLKIDKDYDVKALKARGGDQVISILPKHYNKFIELAMKNKLNPRG